MRVVPSARDIQRMEDCIGWLAWLDPEDARIVWLRAEGVRWRQVCIRAGVVRSPAWRRWAAALLTIAKKLNALEKSGRKVAARWPHQKGRRIDAWSNRMKAGRARCYDGKTRRTSNATDATLSGHIFLMLERLVRTDRTAPRPSRCPPPGPGSTRD